MEARSVPSAAHLPLRERLRELPAVRWARFHPESAAAAVLGLLVVILTVAYGVHDVAQTGLNGLSLGSVYALGAVGLTLVYGILKLVNFAHGEFLTFGAYMAFLINVTWELPFALGVLAGVVVTAAVGVAFEKVLWRPMRRRRAGMLQLLLISLGLALVLRNTIQFI